MNRVPKGPSLFSGVFGFLSKKPEKVKNQAARKASARILASKTQQSTASQTQPYRAAAIVSPECACDAVKAMGGRRFLLREVPRLPVADCTMRKCECSYVRFRDRRSNSADRRALFSVMTNMYTTIGNDERRSRAGRREIEESAAYSGAAAIYDNENWDY